MALLGLDVSSYQPPGKMRWQTLRDLGYSFVYVRGVRMGREIDSAAYQHVRNAREAGFRVGLYSFFDPRQPVAQQLNLTVDVHRVCGVGSRDLAPALDIESIDKGPTADPSWVGDAAAILGTLAEGYGAAIRYHNVRDWSLMGKPTALEHYPLWLADYTPPASLPCVLWQHRSAPIDGYGSMPLDQNAALGELPTIGRPEERSTTCDPAEQPVPWPRFDAAEHSRLRNAAVARETKQGRHG